MDVFNYRCKNIYNLNTEELIVIDNKMCLPINLSKWKDIDGEDAFLRVLKALERITNPKGGTPLLVLSAKLTGFDIHKNSEFIFTDTFLDGRHTIIGKYADGAELIYNGILYLKRSGDGVGE